MAGILSFLRSQIYRAYKRAEVRQHRLFYLFLEITRRCNLSCLHCGSDCSRDYDGEVLTTESWLRLIDDVRQNFGPDVYIVLTGGEPLLHPELEKITSHLAALKMSWGIVTNGLLLNEGRLTELLDDNISSLTVSLDGPEEPHERLRNQLGSFEKTREAIQLTSNALRDDNSLELADVVTCVNPWNLAHLDATAEILIDCGMPAWRLFRIFPTGRAQEDRQTSLSFEQSWEMLHWIEANRPSLKKRGLTVNFSCEGYLPFAFDRKVREVPFFCRAGINFAAILCDGSVTGCSNNDATFTQGNVLENNLRHIWENRFEDFRERAWLQQTDCAGCKHLKMCQGSSIHLWQIGEKSPAFCYLRR